MTGTRSRLTRLLVAALLVVPAIVASVTPSSAAPSKQEVEAAKARLAQLQEAFSGLNEQWNEARFQLTQAENHLAEAKAMKDSAEQQAADARAQLAERAVQAYTDMGSEYEALLSASSMTEFSDRLEFLGAIAQSDSDLAAQADTAAQSAEWAALEYDRSVADAQDRADALEAERVAAQQNLNEQQALAAQLDSDYQQALAQQQLALDSPPPADPAPTGGGGGDGGGYVPPPDATGAQIAIAAARSKLGASYVFGAAGPDVFDCSGFVMWAWAQAGVYLPHSAASQYAVYPRVPLSALQAGDIVYYGNFGPHVAIYMGGGQIIHIRNPSPGGVVQIDSLYGYDQPWGAVRPS